MPIVLQIGYLSHNYENILYIANHWNLLRKHSKKQHELELLDIQWSD